VTDANAASHMFTRMFARRHTQGAAACGISQHPISFTCRELGGKRIALPPLAENLPVLWEFFKLLVSVQGAAADAGTGDVYMYIYTSIDGYIYIYI
jgi:hypothetical protein